MKDYGKTIKNVLLFTQHVETKQTFDLPSGWYNRLAILPKKQKRLLAVLFWIWVVILTITFLI